MLHLTLGLKLSEIGSGSLVLAYILYSSPFTYTLDASGNTLMTNKGSLADATVASGHGVELQVDNLLKVSVPHTLGVSNAGVSSLFGLTTGTGNTCVDDDIDTYTIHNEAIGTTSRPMCVTYMVSITKTYLFTVTVTITSGQAKIKKHIALSDHGAIEVLTVGTYIYTFTDKAKEDGSLIVSFDTSLIEDAVFDGSVVIDTKEITNPNSFTTLINGDGTVEQIDNSIAPSTTYTLTNQTVLEATPTTSPFTIADLALIEADTSLMTRLAKGATDTGLSLVTANVHKHFAFMEYSGADCIDTKDGTIATITNYLDTVRTNVDLNPKGNQTIEFERDGAGVPTAFNNTQMNWHGDGYADLQWNPSLAGNFWIEEIIDGVVYQHKYDGVNLTTYTDNVAGTPTAHTPENASYIVGKGVYPKVTADPYTTYVSPFFSVETTNYAVYDQAARYTILAAI